MKRLSTATVIMLFFVTGTCHASSGLAGDYDGNGLVSAGDLDLVIMNWGSPDLPAGWICDLPCGSIGADELDKVVTNWGNTPTIEGDFNGDGSVGGPDLDLLVTHWGDDRCDISLDWSHCIPTGIVGAASLKKLLNNWGNGL